MSHAQSTAPDARIGPQAALAVGAVAAIGALLATPVLAMAGVLTFVPGLILSVAAPAAFGLVGLAAAAQLYRLDRALWGIAAAAVTLLFALLGTGYGLLTVF